MFNVLGRVGEDYVATLGVRTTRGSVVHRILGARSVRLLSEVEGLFTGGRTGRTYVIRRRPYVAGRRVLSNFSGTLRRLGSCHRKGLRLGPLRSILGRLWSVCIPFF